MSALLDVIYLNRLVAIRRHAKLAVVVVVDRLHVGCRSAFLNVLAFEELCFRQHRHVSFHRIPNAHTFVGRYDEMTSLRADVGGPVKVR